MRPSFALVPVLTVVTLGLAAPVAGASTTQVAAGVLRVEAAPGEANRIVVTRRQAEMVVRDVKAGSAGAGCRVLDPRTVACSAEGLTALEVRAGDKDDSVQILDGLAAKLVGGPGADRLSGGAGDDSLDGSDGSDVIEGGAGADQLSGGTGVDLLAGGAGADVLRGETGEDDLNGEEGDDVLLAGPGDDLLDGGPGIDRVLGERGDDAVVADDGQIDAIACGGGTDRAQVDPADALTDCERLRGPGGSVLPKDAPAEPAILKPLTPFPVVRVTGAVSGSRTRVSRVLVSAPKGSRVESRCSGRGCPYRRRVTTLPKAGGRVALRGLQRSFPAGATFEVFVTQEGRWGKYARFRIRRGRAPERTDRCLRAESMRATECPS